MAVATRPPVYEDLDIKVHSSLTQRRKLSEVLLIITHVVPNGRFHRVANQCSVGTVCHAVDYSRGLLGLPS